MFDNTLIRYYYLSVTEVFDMEKKTKKSPKSKKAKSKKLTKAQIKQQKRLQLPKAQRSEVDIKALKLKLNRAIGQLNGVKKMVEEDRLCEDILIQLSAVKSAVETIKYSLLKELFLDMPQYNEVLEGNYFFKIALKIQSLLWFLPSANFRVCFFFFF